MAKIQIDKEKWLEAIKLAGGLVTIVAERLGVHRITVAKYRDTVPWIKRAFEDEEWRTTDLAQKNIQEEVRTNWKAAAWWLQCKAKDRGFGKEIKVENTEPLGVLHLHMPDDGRDPTTKPEPPKNSSQDGEAKPS